jgi:hypothetical protein
MHSGAWLPRDAWADTQAWDRLNNWVDTKTRHEDIPLVVTPAVDDPLGNPDGLRRIADGAERQNEHGQGRPRSRILQSCPGCGA